MVGLFKNWGFENKEAPIRVLESMNAKAGVEEFEIRSIDHSCNLYFAMSVVVQLGMLGIYQSSKLPLPYDGDADLLTEDQRLELDITKLPLTI
jgi:glutamine synthetase